LTSQAEVGNFKGEGFRDEEVLGFEIAVHNLYGVVEGDSLEQLIKQFLSEGMEYFDKHRPNSFHLVLLHLYIFSEIPFNKFKNEIDCVNIGEDYVSEIDNIIVFEAF
jgi:hypothetical protein